MKASYALEPRFPFSLVGLMRFPFLYRSGVVLLLLTAPGGCSTISSSFSSMTSLVGLGDEGKAEPEQATAARTAEQPEAKSDASSVAGTSVPQSTDGVGAPAMRKDRLYPQAFADDPALIDVAGMQPDEMNAVISALSKPDLVAAEQAQFNRNGLVIAQPFACSTPKLLYRDLVSPVTRAETSGSGMAMNIGKAAVVDSWVFDRCGTKVRYNFLVLITNNDLSKLTTLPPGISLTDLMLMRDTYPKIGEAMSALATKAGKSCNRNNEMIVDRRLANAPGDSVDHWGEIWSVSGCQGITELSISYDARGKSGGTDIRVTPVTPGS